MQDGRIARRGLLVIWRTAYSEFGKEVEWGRREKAGEKKGRGDKERGRKRGRDVLNINFGAEVIEICWGWQRRGGGVHQVNKVAQKGYMP